MQKKKPVHKQAARPPVPKETPAAVESQEVKGLKIILESLKKNGLGDDSKEAKEIKKLIELHSK